MLDPEFLQKTINTTVKNGADYADIFLESRRSLSAQIEDSRVEKLLNGTDAGIGIRVVSRGKTAYGFTNDFDHKSIAELSAQVSRASAGQGSERSIDLRTVRPGVDFPVVKPPDEVPVQQKLKLLRNAEDIARSHHHDIKQVLLIYRDTIQDVRIATSEGTISDDRRVYPLALIQVIASNGKEIQTGYEPIGGFTGYELFDDQVLESLAEKAAARAVMMLKARKAPAGRMAVVISSEAGGTMIHEAIGHGLEADLAGQGLSVYSERLGESVASRLITVVDDATMPSMRGSFRFDDEGTQSQRTVLVENGTLVNYMYDRLYAMKEGADSTGNGRRESYQHRPIPRMSNTYIAPGPDSPDKVIKSVSKGLFVKKMGGGQVNTVTGDFVFDVQEGYIIRGGAICDAVRGATITGNGPAVLKSIDMVASDTGFAIGTCGKDAQGVPVSDAMPTVRIPEMVVGGKIE